MSTPRRLAPRSIGTPIMRILSGMLFGRLALARAKVFIERVGSF
jgi:hypothetical protein